MLNSICVFIATIWGVYREVVIAYLVLGTGIYTIALVLLWNIIPESYQQWIK